LSDEELKQIANKAKELYNRYRSPEATAEIIEVSEDRLVMKFKGSFCETCGLYDWIEDMKYVLRDLSMEVNLVEAKELGNNEYIGIFKIKGIPHKHP